MKKYCFFAFFALLAASGCGGKDKIIAKIGSEKVTLNLVAERLRDTPATYRSYLDTSAGRKQFVDLLIRERIVLESAKRQGVHKKADYKKAMSDFKKEQERRAKDYKENLLMEIFVRNLHANTIKASNDDIKRYYDDHKDEFARPVVVKVRHILLPNRIEADAAMKRVLTGEDFAKIAKELSTDPVSAPTGGLIGPFKRGELVPEFENAVFKLKLGEVSGIVETPFGFHIIKKIEEKAIKPVSFEDSREDIKRIVEKIKFDAWVDQAKATMNVKPNYSLLDSIAKSQPPAVGNSKNSPMPEEPK